MAKFNVNNIIQSGTGEAIAREFQIAKKGIDELTAGVRKLAEVELKKLENINIGSAKGIKELNESVVRVNEAQKVNNKLIKDRIRLEEQEKQATSELAKEVAILRERRKEQNKQLREEARETAGLTDEYERQAKQLRRNQRALANLLLEGKENTAEFRNLRRETNNLDEALKRADAVGGRFQRNVGNYAASAREAAKQTKNFVLQLAGGVGLIQAVRGSFAVIADFDDGLANIQKTTGQTREEVREIANALLEIDTRTGISELQELAAAAGRLGLQGQDVVEFTREVDKAFVALGDSLSGSAEDIGLTLGRIASSFGVEQQLGVGESINRIGSALNELGASSKAQEGAIIDFTQRLAGVASQANISVTEVQALGALFDETGQSIETAATTISQLLPAIGQDTERFAAIAGKSVEEFEKIVREDAFEALKLVAEGAQSNEEGLAGLTETLEAYGVESSRAAGIVGVLSNNIDRLTELQEISNEAFDEGTSLTDEFNVQNETLTATYDKLIKRVQEFILEIDSGTGALGDFLRSGLNFLIDNFETIVRLVGAAVTAFVSYRVTILATRTATQLFADATRLAATFQGLFTRSTKTATAATQGFNKAIKANPLGLFVSVITTGIALLTSFGDEAEDAAGDVNDLADATQRLNDIITNNAKIEEQVANRRNLSLNQLQTLLGRINSQLSETSELSLDVLDDFFTREAIDRLEEIQARIIDLNQALGSPANVPDDPFRLQTFIEQNQLFSDFAEEVNQIFADANLQRSLANQEALTEEERQLVEFRRLIEEQIALRDNGAKRISDADKKAAEKRAKDLERIRRELEDAQNRAIRDEQEREIATINTSFRRRIEAIKGNASEEIQLRLALRAERDREIEKVEKEFAEKQARLEEELADFITRRRNARLLDQFELQEREIRAAFAERRRLIEEEISNEAGLRSELLRNLEAELAAELRDVRREAALADVDFDEQIATARLEQRRSEFDDEKEFEEFKQAELTKIRIKAAEERLALLADVEGKEAELQREQLKALLAQLNADLSNQQEQARRAELKQVADDLETAGQLFLDILEKQSQEREKALEKELDFLEKREQELQRLAERGIENAEENLATLQREQAEIARQQEAERRRQERLKLAEAALTTFNAKVQNGDPNALANTIKDITFLRAFINSLPAFKEGTIDTGIGGDLDKDGGFLSVLHPNERVMDSDNNRKVAGMSNQELADVGYKWSKGLLTDPSKMDSRVLYKNSTNDMSVTNALLREVISTTKAMPKNIRTTTFDVDTLENIVWTIDKSGNRMTRTGRKYPRH